MGKEKTLEEVKKGLWQEHERFEKMRGKKAKRSKQEKI